MTGVDINNENTATDTNESADAAADPMQEKGAPMTEVAAATEKKKLKSAGLGSGKSKLKGAQKAIQAAKEVAAAAEAADKEASDPTQIPPGPLQTVITRNEFYRDGFRNLLKIAIIEAVAIALLIVCFVLYMDNSKPQDRYFATTADGRIMRLVPLNQPNMSRSALMSWVAQAAGDIMTFGFHDYRHRLNEAQGYFTRRGWESFTDALTKSRILEMVEQQQQVVTAAPKSAPIVLNEGIVNGKYRWSVELPLLVSYKSGNSSRAENLMVRLAVERVPTLENVSGVGIAQWIGR